MCNKVVTEINMFIISFFQIVTPIVEGLDGGVQNSVFNKRNGCLFLILSVTDHLNSIHSGISA